ncbi:hypothetical protein N7513_008596 [Penicillium frequentans]|nr:hypothetical protein N7513_008596 [Penicillium glabrum]
MVAINLFHEPSFPEKLMEIPSLCQISALLAAMAAYASRFLPFETDPLTGAGLALTEKCHHNPAHFVDIAFNEINKALAECDDELPPLCVIQALIIATHCQLTRGVHGKAWRSLGLCVRLAYETNLHLLDSRTAAKTEEPAQWKADEEKRRAFWAIWEMDVFASTIRRTPTAIDWTQMEILLPVDNTNWFQSRPASSCFMEAEPNKRWKALQDSGNQSPKAWFLVINSLMKAAQAISNPRGVAPMGNTVNYQPSHRTSTPESVEEARKGLETLANAVRCFGLALPHHLQYRDQHLAFSAIGQHQLDSERQQHCSIYNIFVMTHLARLMIHRYDAFRPQTCHSKAKSRHHPGDSANGNEFGVIDAESVALRHYFDATDSILRIVNQSCEEHIRYINPFLSSTIWLASAVQLVRKHLSRTPSNRSLIKSRFDVLYLTYKRCIQFWDTQTALQQNLESLEVQLEAQQAESNKREARATKKMSKRSSEEASFANQSSSDRQWGQAEHDAKRQRVYLHNSSHASKRNNGPNLSNTAKIQDNYSTQFLPDTPSTPPVQMLTLDHDELERMTNQAYTDEHPDPTQKMAMLDFMPLPEVNPHPISEPYIMPTNPVLFEPMNMFDTQQDRSMEWPNIEFASGIHDLLAGWSMY